MDALLGLITSTYSPEKRKTAITSRPTKRDVIGPACLASSRIMVFPTPRRVQPCFSIFDNLLSAGSPSSAAPGPETPMRQRASGGFQSRTAKTLRRPEQKSSNAGYRKFTARALGTDTLAVDGGLQSESVTEVARCFVLQGGPSKNLVENPTISLTNVLISRSENRAREKIHYGVENWKKERRNKSSASS